jgi:hypothetical protein
MKIRRTCTLHISRTPLVFFIADGAQLATWKGLRSGSLEVARVVGRPEVPIHFSGTVPDAEGALIEWTEGEQKGVGLLANLGEPVNVPIAEIYRADADWVIGAIHWGPRDGDVARPAATSSTVLGEFEVATDVLAITSAPEPPVVLNEKRRKAIHEKGATRWDGGAAFLAVNGTYRVSLEIVARTAESAYEGQRRLRISRCS